MCAGIDRGVRTPFPGGYALKYEHGKYVRGSAGIGMPPGGELTHDFELQRRLTVTITPNLLPEGYTGTVTIHVELLDEDGNPAAGTTTITVNVCGQQIEVTVTDGVGETTVMVGPLGCGRGRHRGPAGPGGQPDPGGPFDPDPHNPTQPPIPPDGTELDNPTYGIGSCDLEIVEPTTGHPIGGNAKVTLKVTMAQGLSVNIDSVEAQEITVLHAVEWITIHPSQGGGDPGNPDGGGLPPVSDTVVAGRRVLLYECTWNTLNPETHNFRHRLVATATFSPGGEMPGGGAGGVTKTAETQPVVGNLTIETQGGGDYPELLLVHEEQTSPLTVQFGLEDGVPSQTEVTVRIYAANRSTHPPADPVRTLTTSVAAPGTVALSWDCKDKNEESVPSGIYTYEATAEQEDGDSDHLRSPWLSIERAVDEETGTELFEVDFDGMDDHSTDDPSDDDLLYNIRWYVLKDAYDQDASAGELRLYDPDMLSVQSWNVADLECLLHADDAGASPHDGLDASAAGMQHALAVGVPASQMDKSGTYRFVLLMTDDHGARCKDHGDKPALELNSAVPQIQFDLDICDGQSSTALTTAVEWTQGAFTVANLNDTDSDGTPDADQHPVSGEQDLMKVVIRVGRSGNGGAATLRVLNGGTRVRLWDTAVKTTQIGLPYQFQIPASTDPQVGQWRYKAFWLEAHQRSDALRDIELEMEYKGDSDKVRATAVWAELEGVKHDAGDTNWPDMTTPPANFVQQFDGFGLRPITAQNGVANFIGFKFRLLPSGIGGKARVAFDITRQMEGDVWVDGVARPQLHRVFDPNDEEPNDDPDNTDESPRPTEADRIYSIDDPGLTGPQSAGAHSYSMRYNGREFVRVRFNGIRPSGNDVGGSRCSAKALWHVGHHLFDEGGTWARSDPVETHHINCVGDGSMPIGGP